VNRRRSGAAFAAAKRVIRAAFNSTVRAFRAVGERRVFVREANGRISSTSTGTANLDYSCRGDRLIAGHAHPSGWSKAAARRRSAGRRTEPRRSTRPSCRADRRSGAAVDQGALLLVRGTEATRNAIRLARGYIGRDKFIKFEGLLITSPPIRS